MNSLSVLKRIYIIEKRCICKFLVASKWHIFLKWFIFVYDKSKIYYLVINASFNYHSKISINYTIRNSFLRSDKIINFVSQATSVSGLKVENRYLADDPAIPNYGWISTNAIVSFHALIRGEENEMTETLKHMFFPLFFVLLAIISSIEVSFSISKNK